MNLYEKYVCTKRTGQMDKKLIAKIAGAGLVIGYRRALRGLLSRRVSLPARVFVL